MPMTTTLDIYHLMSERRLTNSLRDFSNYYLGMAKNYACLRSDRRPSERALIHLFQRLWKERHYVLALRIAWLVLWDQTSTEAAS